MKRIVRWTGYMGMLWLLAACGGDQHIHGEGESKVEVQEKHDHGDAVVFDKAHADAAGLQTAKVKPDTFRGVIKTSGSLRQPRGSEKTVVATVAGILHYANPSLTEGDAVNTKQPIVSISSRHLQEGDPLVKAKLNYETALREYERAKKLIVDQIISAQDYEQARLRYETAKITYEAQAAHLTEDGIGVVSPMNGYIQQLLVADGAYVTVGQPIAVVAGQRRLQLRAEVSERYYRQLSTVTGAHFRPSYTEEWYDVEAMHGRLVAYGKAADSATSFYVPVTFEFDNTAQLVPGSFVEVYLLTAEEQDVLTVEESALVEAQGLFSVFVKVCDEEYVQTPVKIGRRNGQRVEILAGLHEGDEVVMVGATQLKLAAASAAIPEGHSHNH